MMSASPEALHYQKSTIRIAEIKHLVRMYWIERLEWTSLLKGNGADIFRKP